MAGEPGKFVRKETEGSPLAGDTAVVGWALQLCTHFLVTGGEFSQVVGSNSVCGIHPQSHTSATMLGNGVPPQCRSSAQRHPERPWGTVSRRRDDTGGRVGAFLQKDAKSTNTCREILMMSSELSCLCSKDAGKGEAARDGGSGSPGG